MLMLLTFDLRPSPDPRPHQLLMLLLQPVESSRRRRRRRQAAQAPLRVGRRTSTCWRVGRRWEGNRGSM